VFQIALKIICWFFTLQHFILWWFLTFIGSKVFVLSKLLITSTKRLCIINRTINCTGHGKSMTKISLNVKHSSVIHLEMAVIIFVSTLFRVFPNIRTTLERWVLSYGGWNFWSIPIAFLVCDSIRSIQFILTWGSNSSRHKIFFSSPKHPDRIWGPYSLGTGVLSRG
jgi:hypothetical protein